MQVNIDIKRFNAVHALFLKRMYDKSERVHFTNFKHPYLVKEEISYKWKIYKEAIDVLRLEEWRKWKPGSGKIHEATKKACQSQISVNLLYYRKGLDNSSASPLYRVKTRDEKKESEIELYNFIGKGPTSKTEFGFIFDQFASYLREKKLGCNWRFLAYLSFLYNPDQYFPILSFSHGIFNMNCEC